jgi:hypothetical protein
MTSNIAPRKCWKHPVAGDIDQSGQARSVTVRVEGNHDSVRTDVFDFPERTGVTLAATAGTRSAADAPDAACRRSAWLAAQLADMTAGYPALPGPFAVLEPSACGRDGWDLSRSPGH